MTRTAAVESVNLRLDLSCRAYRHAITFVNDERVINFQKIDTYYKALTHKKIIKIPGLFSKRDFRTLYLGHFFKNELISEIYGVFPVSF